MSHCITSKSCECLKEKREDYIVRNFVSQSSSCNKKNYTITRVNLSILGGVGPFSPLPTQTFQLLKIHCFGSSRLSDTSQFLQISLEKKPMRGFSLNGTLAALSVRSLSRKIVNKTMFLEK